MKRVLHQDGFTIVGGVLKAEQIVKFRQYVTPLLDACPAAGIRGLALKIPEVRELSQCQAVRALVDSALSPSARLVRSILFNKNQQTNWQVAWHQDLSIAVQYKTNLEGYNAWTVKEGITHVQPPVKILEKMLTIRIHLDDTDVCNGALKVCPGSHRLGRIPASKAAAVAKQKGEILCEVASGDAIIFHPLLLHASHKATSPNHRRVIHLEYAAVDLPAPLLWNDTA